MKVRIGIYLGPARGPGQFAAAVDLLEQAGVASLWLSELVYSRLVEPFTGMAFALSRTRHLKVGTGVSVLPGRHPVLVAKQLVSLAGLAPRRVLPVFGLRPAQDAERPLYDVAAGPARRGIRRVAHAAAAPPHRGQGGLPRDLVHRGRRRRRAETGQAAGYLAGRLGAGRAAPGRAAGRRLARLAAHALPRPAAAVTVIQEAAAQGPARGRRPLRAQRAGGAGRHPGPAAGLDPPPPARGRPGGDDRPGLGRRPPADRRSTSRPGSASSWSARRTRPLRALSRTPSSAS